jgi:2-oxoglutarate dehydrogenase complex dehydrogenase (E1) component-like enzyme
MKNTIRSLTIIALIFVLGSCSKSSFDYLGKNYPPTTNPEIFFRDQDVPKEYEVMGKVMAEVPYSKKMNYVQKKIETVARENGADAILLSDIDVRQTGSKSARGGVSKRGKVSVGGGGSSTSYTEMKSLEATLLKYK